MWSHCRPRNKWSLGQSRSLAEKMEKAGFKGCCVPLRAQRGSRGVRRERNGTLWVDSGCHSKMRGNRMRYDSCVAEGAVVMSSTVSSQMRPRSPGLRQEERDHGSSGRGGGDHGTPWSRDSKMPGVWTALPLENRHWRERAEGAQIYSELNWWSREGREGSSKKEKRNHHPSWDSSALGLPRKNHLFC